MTYLKNKPTLLLASRMNEINREIEMLEIEYNEIIEELHDRMPHLKDNVNLQPKVRKKNLNDK